MPQKSMAEREAEGAVPRYAAVMIEPSIQQRIGATDGKCQFFGSRRLERAR
ncbi:MAG TPA: hypothetical protein VMM76_09985 [Pirellulaceae bacterium]|nr:hypothetical protein [Pirellulaceae bacterium]